MPGKDLQLDVQITGNESDLAKACGMSVKQLKQLQDAVATVNKAIGRESAAAMNDLNRSTQAAAKGYETVTSSARQTKKQVEETSEAFRQFKATVTGVFTGEALFEGVEAAVHVLEEGVHKVVDLFKEASSRAGEMELKVRGMGNLFRSQSFAESLKTQLQQVAYASPFQLTDLLEAAQRLTGFGVKKEDMLETIKDLGNIVAGIGGGRPEMERAALAYGEAITSQTLTTREINQMTQLGVPVWEELEKMTGKSNQELHKMIEKHMLSSSYMTKVIEDLTHGEGLFTDAMVHFSETFIGLVTTFQDKAGRAIGDLGSVINTFLAAFLKFVNESPLWDALHTWFVNLKEEAQAILTYLPTMFEKMGLMPKLEIIGAKFGDFFKALFGGFDFNQMFKEVMIGSTGNIETVLSPAGNQWIDNLQKFIDPIIELINSFVDFAKDPATVAVLRWFTESMGDAIRDMIQWMTELMHYLDDAIKMAHGLLTFNWGEVKEAWDKFGYDFKKYGMGQTEEQIQAAAQAYTETPETKYTRAKEELNALILGGAEPEVIRAKQKEVDALLPAVDAYKKLHEAQLNNKEALETANKKLTDLAFSIEATNNAMQFLSSTMGNFPITGAGGMTDLTGPGGSLAVREEYDWEGPSSQYGPKGNRLLTGPYVGLNPQEMHKYGVRLGDYVHTQAGWLRVQESASRPGTIEFHADRRGQFENRFQRLNIDAVRRAGESPQASINLHYSPTIQHLGDSSSLQSILRDHAEHIASMVREVHQQELERSAVV
jgi:tape measure domain-containing protein